MSGSGPRSSCLEPSGTGETRFSRWCVCDGLNKGQPCYAPISTLLNFAQLWRRRESNPCEGSEQKRGATRTYPPNPRNRLDKSLPFDPAPSHMMPSNGAESGHKEGTKFQPGKAQGRARSGGPAVAGTRARQRARVAPTGLGWPLGASGPATAPPGATGRATPAIVAGCQSPSNRRPTGPASGRPIFSPPMSDSNTAGSHSMDATKIAAALSAFLDLPRVMRDLEATLRHLQSVVTGAEERRDDRLADGERGLWDAVQVARFLRVSRSWVYQRAESGLLPCRHVGGLLRFEADAIREYARTGTIPDPLPNRHQQRVGFGVESRRTTTKASVEPLAPPPRPAPEEPIQASPLPPSPDRNALFDYLEADTAQKERLLGVRQVAERLRVSTATVYKLCERGELLHTRVVNVIRVAPEDLEAFIVPQVSLKSRGGKKRRT